MISIIENLGIEGTYLNIIKAIYSKPRVNILLNRKKKRKKKALPLKPRVRWVSTPPPTLSLVKHRTNSKTSDDDKEPRKYRPLQLADTSDH